MSKKQEIYTEMLSRAIPQIRNVQTQSMVRKALDKSCYLEAELVHNLYYSLLEPEFVEHDIYFLNTQAKNYYEQASSKISSPYEGQIESIEALYNMVPEHLKEKLTWPGPTVNKAF